MISARHYSIALIGAVLIHLLGLLLISYSTHSGSATGKGDLGIEVDLGMLGDLGSATETRQNSATQLQEVEQVAEIEQTETVEESVIEPVQEAIKRPMIEQEIVLKQEAEIVVKKVPAKQIDKVHVEKTPASFVTTDAAAGDSSANPQAENSPAILKASTGSANALTSGGATGNKQTYYAVIAARLAKYKRYPIYSRKKGQEGTVLLSFTVLNSGLVKGISIKKSSGYSRLDRAVEKMLKEASPLPPFPEEQSLAEITITIPIVFKLNHA
ncbi:MAG: energy transducer TonB [Psychromonas sp.]